jgi:hypothetical protein
MKRLIAVALFLILSFAHSTAQISAYGNQLRIRHRNQQTGKQAHSTIFFRLRLVQTMNQTQKIHS